MLRLILLLALCALLLFSLAFLLKGITLFIYLASFCLLSAFVLLILLGLTSIIHSIIHLLKNYYAAPQRALRQLNYIQLKTQNAEQLMNFKKDYIDYQHQIKLKKLLTKDEKKQLKLLNKAITGQLKSHKHLIPKELFNQLQQEHKNYQRDNNISALVQLQQRILVIIG